jgi:DNA-binding response OmpR family regulator
LRVCCSDNKFTGLPQRFLRLAGAYRKLGYWGWHSQLRSPEGGVKKPIILIADDEPHMRMALRKRLLAFGYEVVEAPDGLGVLSQCPKGWVDLVILDQEMPNGDGRSIARVVRKETDVPIVFLSGHDRDEFRPLVATLPNVYFLSKPLDEERLRTLLASLLPIPDPQRPMLCACAPTAETGEGEHDTANCPDCG